MKFPSIVLPSCALLLHGVTAKSDCQCITGFDPDDMPKMNVTNFVAGAFPNGTSIYSWDLSYWPSQPLASCGATVQGGQSGVLTSVWGDKYCWDKADGSWVPVYWWWNQTWPEADFSLRIESRYLVTSSLCYECVESGTHIVSAGDLKRTDQTVVYGGRKDFAVRPMTWHG